MKRILYTRPDGGLSIVNPALGGRLVASFNDDKFSPPITADRIAVETAVLVALSDNGQIKWAETEDEWIARIRAKDVPSWAINTTILDESKIPTDRTFRDAWQLVDGNVVVDMSKARDIHRDRLSLICKIHLEALDVAFQKVSDPERKKKIEASREALRNLTASATLEGANTPEELKLLWPEDPNVRTKRPTAAPSRARPTAFSLDDDAVALVGFIVRWWAFVEFTVDSSIHDLLNRPDTRDLATQLVLPFPKRLKLLRQLCEEVVSKPETLKAIKDTIAYVGSHQSIRNALTHALVIPDPKRPKTHLYICRMIWSQPIRRQPRFMSRDSLYKFEQQLARASMRLFMLTAGCRDPYSWPASLDRSPTLDWLP
jgi:hypothetical protein